MSNSTASAPRPTSGAPVPKRVPEHPPMKPGASGGGIPDIFTSALADAFFGERRVDAAKVRAPIAAVTPAPTTDHTRTVEAHPPAPNAISPVKPAERARSAPDGVARDPIDDQGLRRVAVHVGLPFEHVRAVALGPEVEPTDVPLVVPKRVTFAAAAKVIRRDRRVLRQWCVDHPDLAPIPTGKSLPRWVWDDAESVIAFRDAVRERERAASLPPPEPAVKPPRRSPTRPEAVTGKGVTKADLLDRLLPKKKP